MASSRSWPSLSVASASTIRRPRCTTRPSHVTRPVSVVMPRRNFTFRSTLPAGVGYTSVECTAHPAAESSSVANTPPCTEPIGL